MILFLYYLQLLHICFSLTQYLPSSVLLLSTFFAQMRCLFVLSYFYFLHTLTKFISTFFVYLQCVFLLPFYSLNVYFYFFHIILKREAYFYLFSYTHNASFQPCHVLFPLFSYAFIAQSTAFSCLLCFILPFRMRGVHSFPCLLFLKTLYQH